MMGGTPGSTPDRERKRMHMEDMTLSSKPNKEEEESGGGVAGGGEDSSTPDRERKRAHMEDMTLSSKPNKEEEESGGGVAGGGEDKLDVCNLEPSPPLAGGGEDESDECNLEPSLSLPGGGEDELDDAGGGEDSSTPDRERKRTHMEDMTLSSEPNKEEESGGGVAGGGEDSSTPDRERKRTYMEDMTPLSNLNKEEEESGDGVAGGGEDKLDEYNLELSPSLAGGGEDELDECNLERSLSPSSQKRPRSPEQSSPLPALPSSSPPSLFLSPSPIIPRQDHRPSSFHLHPFLEPVVRLPLPTPAAMLQVLRPLSRRLTAFAPDQLPTSAAVAAAATAEPVFSTSTVAIFAPSSGRGRRSAFHAPRAVKDDLVPAPFAWATDRRATVHSLAYLRSVGIRSIIGKAQCKRCDSQSMLEYDLESKFSEIEGCIRAKKSTMHDRAPNEWVKPRLPNCQKCGEHDCINPLISSKKRSINWLLLFLGTMLGCCTIEQLRYFCKHTNNDRTGPKDRLLYLAYLGLCKQLDPDGPFDP